MALKRPSAGRAVLDASVVVAIVVSLQAGVAALAAPVSSPARSSSSPIQHVVVIYQENHTFDETLGGYCRPGRPDAMDTAGRSPEERQVVRMTQSPDIVPHVIHDVASQVTAIDGGAMDGWGRVRGCTAPYVSMPDLLHPESDSEPRHAGRSLRGVGPDVLDGRLAVLGWAPLCRGRHPRRVHRRHPDAG